MSTSLFGTIPGIQSSSMPYSNVNPFLNAPFTSVSNTNLFSGYTTAPAQNFVMNNYLPTYNMPTYNFAPTYNYSPRYIPAPMPMPTPQYIPQAPPQNNIDLSQLLQTLLPQLLSKISQQNVNGDNINNDTTVKNNGDINPVIYNIIIGADNVNIAGVNTGVQLNNDGTITTTGAGTGTTTTTQSKPSTPVTPPAPQTAKERRQARRASKDPLVVDLDGNGIKTSAQKTITNIDGQNVQVNNIDNGDGVITLNGQILGDKTDLSSLGITGTASDAQNALLLIARKAFADGAISSPANLTAQDLQVLHDQYGIAIRVGDLNGQDETFAQAGVNGMNLSSAVGQTLNNFDGHGNTITNNGSTITRQNGTLGMVGDIWFN